ncbi:MAG: hypothetical protein ACE5L7_08380 [Candidatus Aminicenantales bacterium]
MNDKNEDTLITEKDLVFIEKELSKTTNPLPLDELTKKLAFQKTSPQRTQMVKVYDPYCQYEVGDLIYKEYDEPLMISSKGVEPFKGGVVLKITNKIDYKSFNCEMLEVNYSGGGAFRKHIDYMKKTKTQVLLPSNLEKKAKTPQILKKEEDPRQDQLPMTERDMKRLRKNLKSALSKSPKFFNWDGFWQLKENMIPIKEEKIKEIEKYLSDKRQSAETTELVSRFFSLSPDDDLFPLHCMSFNSFIEKKYRKNFVFVSPQNWGKWLLKQVLHSHLDNLPLAAPKAKAPPFDKDTLEEPKISKKFPLKVYLTWREILSGGLKVPRVFDREFSMTREYVFTDEEAAKDYSVYYYPSYCFFLGLKDFYESYNIPQGASLTLERKGPNQFSFWIKKSKKKLSVSKLDYNPAEDRFIPSKEEVFTYAVPNKIIHLQRETVNRLLSLYDQRNDFDLRELLILVFKNFGAGAEQGSLHYMRAYHMVDILKRTSEEDVERTVLNSPEFKKSEKKKGIFLYQEAISLEEEEAPPEVPSEPEIEEGVEEVPSEAPSEKIAPLQLQKERKEKLQAEAPPAAQEISIEEPTVREKPTPPKREKELKKKRPKVKVEAEKEFRRRKGEKRIIEERIEIEESEQEALIAIKAEEKKEMEEERADLRPEEKRKEYKPYTSEGPVFGVFAEKLKSALEEKKKGKKK